MTLEEIQKRLDAMASAMSEAGIKSPEAILRQKSGGRHSIHLGALYDTTPFDGEKYKIIFGDNIGDLLTEAERYIATLPDPDAMAKRNWQGKLGKVIDEGHALNLPDDVMQPLRQGSQAMTENLLAAPGDMT